MPPDSELHKRIQGHLSALSPKQQQLARLVLDEPAFVALVSAQALAERVGASAATVVRFCQALDYEGYPDLQAAIRDELPFFRTPLQRAEQLRSLQPGEDLVQRVFEQDLHNLERTRESLNVATFERAVEALCRADRVLVVGAGLSSAPALFFGHSLRVLGFHAQAILAGGIPFALELARLGPESVYVGISLWRYVRETVEGMHRAREQGVHTIAITDSLVSPLTELADETFVAVTDSVAQSRSPTALIALLDAFIAAISFQRPDQVVASLRQVDEIYRTSGLVIDSWSQGRDQA
ncbi:MAG: MurR/RpiR family transcriptional regulator [Ardenticatenaceae bacterium]|nr:MurR/RpiR family transcriptional regulator [Ardenticatenaceae bacterium]HBY96650.1 hypothetical protein [Chloroflexota bacterium]